MDKIRMAIADKIRLMSFMLVLTTAFTFSSTAFGKSNAETFEVSVLEGVSVQEAAEKLGFNCVVEVPNLRGSIDDFYAFNYDGQITLEPFCLSSGEVSAFRIPSEYTSTGEYSYIWGFGNDTVYWTLYLRDPGYSFYGIEVGMSEDEAKRLESGIPDYSSLGFWRVLCDKGKVKEIRTYPDG